MPRDPAQAIAWYRRASGLDSGDFVPSAPSQIELEGLRQDLRRREQEVERLRRELDALRRPGAGATGAPPDAAQASQLELEIARLRDEADQMRVQLSAKPPPGTSLPAPTIQILDPDVPLTRGVKIVQTLEAETQRVVVGHVEAPAGLMSLTLNDASLAVTDKGMFRSEVLVAEAGTRVVIVATDGAAAAPSARSCSRPGARARLRSRPRARRRPGSSSAAITRS